VRIVLAAGVLLAAAGALAIAVYPRPSAAPEHPALVVTREMDGFRYEYHVVFDRETLLDLRDGPQSVRNVLDQHPDVAAKCRHALEADLAVHDLSELRAPHDETVQRLKALGYVW
jgi:hypothetical protein